MKTYPDLDTMHENFRMNLNNLIYLKNLTIAELAKQCQVSVRLIYNYTSKTQRLNCIIPNSVFLLKVADFFQVNPYDLLLKKMRF